MDWFTLLITLISVLFGGGIVSVLTIREQRKGMRLDNKVKQQDIHIKLIDELQEQIEKLNERLDKKDELLVEKDDIIADLRMKLDAARTKLAVANMLKCNKLQCSDRQPPFASSVVDMGEALKNYVENVEIE